MNDKTSSHIESDQKENNRKSMPGLRIFRFQIRSGSTGQDDDSSAETRSLRWFERPVAWTKQNPILASLLYSGVMTFLFWLAVSGFQDKTSYITISAETESVSYQVVREGIANIPVDNAEILRGAPSDCDSLLVRNAAQDEYRFTGLVAPVSGALVRYRMVAEAIVIDMAVEKGAVGQLLTHNGLQCELESALRFRYQYGLVGAINNRPLPIAGPAEMGVEFGEPLAPRSEGRREIGLLHSGEIRIFGRSLLPPGNSSLYPAGDAVFPLPAGGRLTTLLHAQSSAKEKESTTDGRKDELSVDAAWYGVAMIGNGRFSVSATTETDDLYLYRPGRSADAERFRPTLFARLFNDPSTAIFSILFLMLTVLIQTLTGLLGLLKGSKPE